MIKNRILTMNSKKQFACLVTIMCLAVFIFSGFLVVAENHNPTRIGLNDTVNEAFEKKLPSADIPSILGKVVLYGLGLIGIVFFTLIVLAGFKWMTAGGHAEDIEKAQEMLRHAIIGIIITMGSAAITWFILQNVKTATTPETKAGHYNNVKIIITINNSVRT